jgi:hypothetical protein
MVLAGTSRKEADVPRPRSVFPFPSLSFSSLSLSCSSPNIQWRFHHRSRLDSRFVDIIRSVPWNVPFRSVWANKQTNKQSPYWWRRTDVLDEREGKRPPRPDPADPALVWFFGLNECERRSATTRCCRTTTESVVRSGRNGDARKTADAPAHTHAHRRATTTTTTT